MIFNSGRYGFTVLKPDALSDLTGDNVDSDYR